MYRLHYYMTPSLSDILMQDVLVNFSTCFHATAGSQVEFQFDDYVVVEDAGAVEVCVVLLGKTLTESGRVSVSTQGGSAIGNYRVYVLGITNTNVEYSL